jgi:hypothetical protein
MNNACIPRFKINLKQSKIQLRSLAEEFPIRPSPVDNNDYDKFKPVERGDVVVTMIYDILKDLDIISELVNTSGLSNNQFDIIVRTKKDGFLRCLQIKKLTKIASSSNDDYWRPDIQGCQYPQYTLMVFLNLEKTRFGLGYWKDVAKNMQIRLSFKDNSITYNDFKFTDIEAFKNQLYVLVPNAHIINDIRDGILSCSDLKEYDSIRNIKRICESQGIKFEYNYTNGNQIDIYLNGYTCQCKCSGYMHGQLYVSNCYKKINSVHVPYEVSDGITYFIFQISDNLLPDEYKHNICIIPSTVLIDSGLIKTESQSGRVHIAVAPPDFANYHWTLPFWNNFEVIKSNSQFISDPIYNFMNRYHCIIKNIFKKNERDIYQTSLSESNRVDTKIEYLLIFINNGKIRLFKDMIFIISKSDILKECKIVGPTKQKSFSIISPNCKRDHWSLKYWKNVSDLNQI